MTVRLTRRLLLSALLAAPAATAAEPPRPIAPPPALPTADAQVYLTTVIAEVPTAALARLIAKYREASDTPEVFTLDAAAADLFARDCATAGDILSRPRLLLTDGQTGFFQVGRQLPSAAGRPVPPGGGAVPDVTYADVGLALKVTPKLVGGDRAELRIDFSMVRPNPTPVPVGEGKDGRPLLAAVVDTQQIETTRTVRLGRALVLEVGRTRDKTLLVTVAASRFEVATATGEPSAPPASGRPVAEALGLVGRVTVAEFWQPTDMARDLVLEQAQARQPGYNPLGRWQTRATVPAAPPEAVFSTPLPAVGYRLTAQPGVQLVQAVAPPSPARLLTGQPVMLPLAPWPVAPPPSRVFHVKDLAAPALCTKVFPVMDLVTPIPGFALPASAMPAEPPTAEKNAAALVKLLTAHVRPGSWKPDGGTGSAEFFGIGGVLVVNHTPDAVREVETLLDALRKAQGVCIHTEVHVVRLPVGEAEKLGLCDGPPAADKPTFRSDQQMYDAREAMRGNPRFADMQMPKISLFNGQAGSFCVGDPVNPADKDTAVLGGLDSPGVVVRLQPVVSADRRTVRVAVGGKVWCDPETLLTVGHAAPIPDGRTLVLYAGRRPERTVRCESGPPVLSQIPYVNRLFKTTGIGTEPAEDVFVLVTPRIVVNQEPGQAAVAQAAFVAPPASPAAELVARYKAALAAGKPDEAVRLAVQALALDPHCFGR